MKTYMRYIVIPAVIASLAMTGACGNKAKEKASELNPMATAQQTPGQGGPSAANTGGINMLQDKGSSMDGSLPLRHLDGEDYVQASKLLEIVGFRSVWEANQNVLKFGDNDAAFEVKVNSNEARRDEDVIKLKKTPVLMDGIPYLPVSALGDLLTDEVTFNKQGENLVLTPSNNATTLQVDEDRPMAHDDLDFGDDPNDPNKGVSANDIPTAGLPRYEAELNDAIPAAALKNINIPSLIARAKTYLGVKYDFGAAPYPEGGKFDCSSYTQYLFGKYGVTLPRLARTQGKLGTTVSRSNLRVGDLLYFYVPGRFQSNKTVGHVGIYMGDRKMIHSCPIPKDGVQITNIDKAYWKEVFLFAKRIVE